MFTVRKNKEEQKMNKEQREFIKNFTLGIENFFEGLSEEEKEAIEQAISEYPIDLNVNPDVNLYDIFGSSLELLPIQRPLSPTMEKEINKIIQRRIEKMEKEYIKQIWVCVSPDNGHWNEKFVHEEVERIAKKWNVQAVATAQTRDRWYGQERLFAVSGESENIEGFELELDEALY